MSWGTELWDKLDEVALQTQREIEFCEKLSSFFKDRCAIESEYSSKIRKLVKSHQLKPSSKNDDSLFSYEREFMRYMRELSDYSGQRDIVSESINGTLLKDVQVLLIELRQIRKKLLQDAAKQENALQAQLNELEKSRKHYEKSCREAEKTAETYSKSEADIHLSRADVEKARVSMVTKRSQCDQSKLDYAAVLQTTNNVQRDHYHTHMPSVFQEIQNSSERCITRVGDYIRMAAESEVRVLPILNTCVEGMLKAAQSVNAKEDSQKLIERHKTGFSPPEDIEFEEMDQLTPAAGYNNGSGTSLNSTPSNTIGGTLNGFRGSRETVRSSIRSSQRGERGGASQGRNRSKKRGRLLSGLFGTQKNEEEREDFGHLPPTQQKKRLKEKLNSLAADLAKLESERVGLQKMEEVYRSNKKLGDPRSLRQQFEQNERYQQQLKSELDKYQGYLAVARGEALENLPTGESTTRLQQRTNSLSSSNAPYDPSTGSITPTSTLPPSLSLNCVGGSTVHRDDDTASLSGSPLILPAGGRLVSPAPVQTRDRSGDQLSANSSGHRKHRHSRQKERTSDGAASQRVSDVNSQRTSAFDDSFDEFNDEDDVVFQPIGTCVALYAFEPTSEGTIEMRLGEEFNVLEKDQGDGWTRVERFSSSNREQGFVPTSYIQARIQTSV